jgi:hypothetical protein
VPAIALAETSYAKHCIPAENNCNVTAVTARCDGRTLLRDGRTPAAISPRSWPGAETEKQRRPRRRWHDPQ